MDAITFHFQLRQLSGSISDTRLYTRQQTSKFKTDFLPRYMLWLTDAYELYGWEVQDICEALLRVLLREVTILGGGIFEEFGTVCQAFKRRSLLHSSGRSRIITRTWLNP